MSGVARINTGTGGFTGGSATTIATAATSLTTGNFIVACVRRGTASISVSSVTDTAGNTYHHAIGPIESGAGAVEIWYSENVTGNASNVVTANFSGATISRSIITAQFYGMATSSSLDQTASGTSTGASPVTSGSLTTTRGNEVLIVAAEVSVTGSTWTEQANVGRVLQDSSAVMVVGSTYLPNVITETVAYASSDTTNVKAIAVATFKMAEAPSGGAGGAWAFA